MIEKSILLSILLVGSFIPVLAQMQPTQSQVTPQALSITFTTDKQSYQDGDIMTISGSVREVLADLPVTIEIRDPTGNIVMVTQVHPESDNTFSVHLTTGGFLWKASGAYSILAQYGGSSRSQIIYFQFGGFVPSETIPVGGTNMSVSYKISNGEIANITADVHTKSLFIFIKSTANGNVTMTLPRTLIDAKTINGADSSFVVTDHGFPAKFQESKSNTTRTLTMPFSGPTVDRLIVTGTQIVPEFGTITPLILVIAVVGITLLTTANKFQFAKKL